MTHATLLPPNATNLERALEQASARIADVPTPVRNIWSPDNCPIELLPWLAWGLSIDNWSSDWAEAVKRSRVRNAIPIARKKGTAKSVRDVVASFGGTVAIREWHQLEPKGNPHSFNLLLNLNQNGAPANAAFVEQVIDEVRRTKPVRSYFTFTQGVSFSAGIRLAVVARPALIVRLSCDAPAAV
jgi:phage tail P2-like protein